MCDLFKHFDIFVGWGIVWFEIFLGGDGDLFG